MEKTIQDILSDLEAFLDKLTERIYPALQQEVIDGLFIVDSHEEWEQLSKTIVERVVERLGIDRLGLLASALLEAAIQHGYMTAVVRFESVDDDDDSDEIVDWQFDVTEVNADGNDLVFGQVFELDAKQPIKRLEVDIQFVTKEVPLPD
jgi:hypothetical protein